MVSIGTLIGYLVLDDKLSPSLKVARANVLSMSKDLDKMGSSLEKAGRDIMPLSVALGVAGTAAFKFGKDFETTLTQIQSLVGETAQQVDVYRDSIMGLSKDVAKSPQELAEALYFITSSGQQGEEALRTLSASAKASAIGLGETKIVADAATSAINAYGKENLSADEAVRVLIATVREGKGEADAIAGSFGRIIPIAAEMGVRIQDLGAFMAATTKIGLSAEESATALRGALTTISAPTKEQTDAFADLSERGLLPMGFNLEAVRKKIREEGLAEGFMQLTEATKGNSEALTAIIGNVRAATGVLGAYGRQGETTLEVQKKMRQDLGEIDRGFKLVSETVDFKWKQALADMQATAIGAFGAMKPAFSVLLDGASGAAKGLGVLVEGFKELPQPIQIAVGGVLGLTAAAGPALLGLGAAFKGAKVAMDGLALALANPAVIGSLAMIAQGALVVGTAIASWKLGEKIADIKLFGEEQMSLGESFSFGILKLQQWTGFLDASDADIENSILAQRNLGTAVTETAEQIITSTEGIGFAADELVTQTEQARNMTAEWNAEMLKLSESVINLTDEQREAIRVGIEMEKSTGDIATGLGISEAAVKAYAGGLEEANRKVEEFMEKQRKSAEETAKLNNELAAGAAKLAGTDLDARLASIDAWFADETAKIEGVGAAYEAHYAALEKLRDQKRAAEQTDIEQMNELSREALEQQAEVARNTYQDMIYSGLNFSREVLDGQKQKVKDAEQAVRDYGKSWDGVTEGTTQATQGANAFFDNLGKNVDESLQKMGKLKQSISETYTMDIPSLTKTQIKEIQSKYDMAGSMLGKDPDIALRRRLAELEDLEGTYAPKSKEQYVGMLKDQVQLSQLRQYFENKPDAGLATTPESVYPRTTQPAPRTSTESTTSVSGSARSIGGGAVGGWGGVTLNNYINGTGTQVANVVSNELMRVLKTGRQFGSA